MSQVKIQAAFEKRLKNMPGGLAFTGDATNRTAVENVPYTPTSGSPYQALTLAAGVPENPTFGPAYHREVGIFRIRLYYPKNTGAGAMRAQAQAIKEYFVRGTTMIQDGLEIIIRRTPTVGNSVVLDDRFSINVDLDYYASVYTE